MDACDWVLRCLLGQNLWVGTSVFQRGIIARCCRTQKGLSVIGLRAGGAKSGFSLS